MNKKDLETAVKEMRKAGLETMKEREGNFSFGEWAGESEREIIYSITGLEYDDLSPEDVDELCDAFLGF